jgi:hypothetical protein
MSIQPHRPAEPKVAAVAEVRYSSSGPTPESRPRWQGDIQARPQPTSQLCYCSTGWDCGAIQTSSSNLRESRAESESPAERFTATLLLRRHVVRVTTAGRRFETHLCVWGRDRSWIGVCERAEIDPNRPVSTGIAAVSATSGSNGGRCGSIPADPENAEAPDMQELRRVELGGFEPWVGQCHRKLARKSKPVVVIGQLPGSGAEHESGRCPPFPPVRLPQRKDLRDSRGWRGSRPGALWGGERRRRFLTSPLSRARGGAYLCHSGRLVLAAGPRRERLGRAHPMFAPRHRA